MSAQAALALDPPAPTAPTPAPTEGTPPPADNPNTRGHSPARDQREASAAPSAADKMLRIGDKDVPESAITAALQAKAEADLRATAVPPSPDKYDVRLPEGFVMPVGQEFEINPDDPVMAPTLSAAKDFAHRHNLTQDAFSELVALYGSTKSAEDATLRAAVDAERVKLGANGPARIDAISTWLTGVLGKDLAGPMVRHLHEAAQVEAFEKIYQRMSNQGGASFTQQYRSHSDPKTIAGFESMSFKEQRAAQDRVNGVK